jgi:transposase
MGSRVELFEQIRRDHDREAPGIRELARRHKVHRRTVRQALAQATPPARKKAEGRLAPKLGPYHDLIDEWIVADKDAPKKQRHTARRIWQRLVEEHGADVAEITVRKWVHKRRRELGEVRHGHVPQHHHDGHEAEVDWGKAQAYIGGVLTEVCLFVMRSSASGAGFFGVFPAETQQAFFEGHAEAFEFFGGVFARIRYDNLTSAVQKVLKGRRRIEQERFVAFRSHYLFESFFTLAGIEGAHEKGGVEGEVGRFRRRNLVPVPAVASFGELKKLVREGVDRDLSRRIKNRRDTVGEALMRERETLRTLPSEPYAFGEQSRPIAGDKALCSVRQNHYSVPCGLIGMRLVATTTSREVVFHHHGREVARHERVYGRLEIRAQLDHYLELLRTKPGALAGSLALHQERERGSWPGVYDELWRALEARYDTSQAARQMVDVLMLAREVGPDRLRLACAGALAAGAIDGRAVALLARREPRPAFSQVPDLPEHLTAIVRTTPDIKGYDELLEGGR